MSHFGQQNLPHPEARCPVCGVSKFVYETTCSPLCTDILDGREKEVAKGASKPPEDARCALEIVNEGVERETRLETAYEVAEREKMDALEQRKEQLRSRKGRA